MLLICVLITISALKLICDASVGSVISQGINAGDVKKLQDAGIYTCNGLMMHTKKVLDRASQFPVLCFICLSFFFVTSLN
jgi:hypothetical protein